MRVWSTMGALCALWLLIGCRPSHGAELVGDQCLPDSLPSGPAGEGFLSNDSYTTKSEACDGHPCLVHQLANTSDGGGLLDPSVQCEGDDPAPGCVTAAALERSVHCSCQCSGPGDQDNYCLCPNGFTCRELATVRDDGLRNGPRGYCVKPQALQGI